MLDYVVPVWMYPVLFWTLAWKGIAGWKAARRGHLSWFIAFLVLNTFGILPILYYFFLDKVKFYSVDDKKNIKKVVKKSVKKSSSKKIVKKIPTLA